MREGGKGGEESGRRTLSISASRKKLALALFPCPCPCPRFSLARAIIFTATGHPASAPATSCPNQTQLNAPCPVRRTSLYTCLPALISTLEPLGNTLPASA